MNSIFLDPSSEHWNPQTNSRLVLSCFKTRLENKLYQGGGLLEAADAPASYRAMAGAGNNTYKKLARVSIDWLKN